MQIVLESLDEGFCHVTRKTRDLDLIGTCSLCHVIFLLSYNVKSRATGSMGDIKVLAAPGGVLSAIKPRDSALNSLIVDLPKPESFIKRKHDVLARFIYVLKPLADLYKIPQTSLQVFADKEGQLISFNRSGCLVMNLRYFEAWRTSWVSALLQRPILVEACQTTLMSNKAISRRS